MNRLKFYVNGTNIKLESGGNDTTSGSRYADECTFEFSDVWKEYDGFNAVFGADMENLVSVPIGQDGNCLMSPSANTQSGKFYVGVYATKTVADSENSYERIYRSKLSEINLYNGAKGTSALPEEYEKAYFEFISEEIGKFNKRVTAFENTEYTAEAVLADDETVSADVTLERSADSRQCRFNFVIPRGKQGEQGIQGIPGKDGYDGKNGIDGKDGKDGRDGIDGKNATIKIGSVKTSNAAARVTNSGTENDVVLNFELPRGPKGLKGDKGDPGTTDYSEIINAPAINGIVLKGNQTADDLGLVPNPPLSSGIHRGKLIHQVFDDIDSSILGIDSAISNINDEMSNKTNRADAEEIANDCIQSSGLQEELSNRPTYNEMNDTISSSTQGMVITDMLSTINGESLSTANDFSLVTPEQLKTINGESLVIDSDVTDIKINDEWETICEQTFTGDEGYLCLHIVQKEAKYKKLYVSAYNCDGKTSIVINGDGKDKLADTYNGTGRPAYSVTKSLKNWCSLYVYPHPSGLHMCVNFRSNSFGSYSDVTNESVAPTAYQPENAFFISKFLLPMENGYDLITLYSNDNATPIKGTFKIMGVRM